MKRSATNNESFYSTEHSNHESFKSFNHSFIHSSVHSFNSIIHPFILSTSNSSTYACDSIAVRFALIALQFSTMQRYSFVFFKLSSEYTRSLSRVAPFRSFPIVASGSKSTSFFTRFPFFEFPAARWLFAVCTGVNPGSKKSSSSSTGAETSSRHPKHKQSPFFSAAAFAFSFWRAQYGHSHVSPSGTDVKFRQLKW